MMQELGLVATVPNDIDSEIWWIWVVKMSLDHAVRIVLYWCTQAHTLHFTACMHVNYPLKS